MSLDFKRLLNLEETQVLGLDIGSSAVRIIQLRKDDDGYVVTAAGVADVANGVGDDQKQRTANTVKAISECLQLAGAQSRLAVCGVCGPEVAVRYFKFPSMPSEELHGAVLLEAAQVCPFNIDDSAVDYQVIPNGKESVCGVLVAATNKLIERKRQLAREVNLDCVLMDVDGLALLNCFSEYDKAKSGQTTAILNIGSSYTTLAIKGANASPFIRDIAYAGMEIVEEIARDKDVSAETVKRALLGCEDSEKPQMELGDSLAKACRRLVIDITETLRYYTAQEKSAVVEKIFVCGFASAKGFVELLDSRLPVQTVLWNPFDKIPCDGDQNCRDILAKNGPAMAVAAGLAMRSI
ncbi:MAG: type IV pilus assembly protein PilM [Phycisphaerae bacterium]|nr:type IV pilus assembly protein PilM [Phycisphaerae bacterium]